MHSIKVGTDRLGLICGKVAVLLVLGGCTGRPDEDHSGRAVAHAARSSLSHDEAKPSLPRERSRPATGLATRAFSLPERLGEPCDPSQPCEEGAECLKRVAPLGFLESWEPDEHPEDGPRSYCDVAHPQRRLSPEQAMLVFEARGRSFQGWSFAVLRPAHEWGDFQKMSPEHDPFVAMGGVYLGQPLPPPGFPSEFQPLIGKRFRAYARDGSACGVRGEAIWVTEKLGQGSMSWSYAPQWTLRLRTDGCSGLFFVHSEDELPLTLATPAQPPRTTDRALARRWRQTAQLRRAEAVERFLELEPTRLIDSEYRRHRRPPEYPAHWWEYRRTASDVEKEGGFGPVAERFVLPDVARIVVSVHAGPGHICAGFDGALMVVFRESEAGLVVESILPRAVVPEVVFDMDGDGLIEVMGTTVSDGELQGVAMVSPSLVTTSRIFVQPWGKC